MGKFSESAEDESFEKGRPFAERKDRYPLDRMLREVGFKIERRVEGEEPVWTRHGVEFTESEAMDFLSRVQEHRVKKK